MKFSWSQFAIEMTSRKFWLAVVSFIASMYLTFGGDASTANEIVGVCWAVLTVVGYFVSSVFGKKLAEGTVTTDAFLSAVKTLADSPLVKELVIAMQMKIKTWINKQSLPDGSDGNVGGTDD